MCAHDNRLRKSTTIFLHTVHAQGQRLVEITRSHSLLEFILAIFKCLGVQKQVRQHCIAFRSKEKSNEVISDLGFNRS